MDFIHCINTPVGKTESDPLITTIKLSRGRLVGGFVYFPSGPAGTLHFLAKIGVHQIIPFNTGQNLRLDDCVVPLSFGIDLLEPPCEIDLVTWNDSTQYAHTLTVGLFLDPKKEQGWKILEALKLKKNE